MNAKKSLIEEIAAAEAENDRQVKGNLKWYKEEGLPYLEGTRQSFTAKTNFDSGPQPHAGLRERMRFVIRDREGF